MKCLYKSLIVFLVSAVGFVSCTNGFDEANKNPNAPDKETPDYLFTTSVYSTVGAFNGEIKKRLLGNYAQYYWGQSDQMGRYGNYPGSNDTYWRNSYNNSAFPVRFISDKYSSNPAYKNRVLIARIWENYIFSQIVAIWGSVPMTNALKATQAVPYDKEETIYYYILENLKNCAAQLTENGDSYSDDPVFKLANKSSDIAKWKKFAHSLRFRIAMRISNDAPNGNPLKAREVITELMADESVMIESSGDECLARWGNTSSTRNYFYDFMIVEREANKDKLSTAGEAILQHMAPYSDPRVDKFFTVAKAQQMPTNFHWAPYWGQPKNSSTPPGVSINPNPHSGKSSGDYSMVRDDFFVPDYAEMLLGYSEMCFLKCEAIYRGFTTGTKSAEDYYYDGIRASMSRFAVDASAVNAYLEVGGVKWNTLTDVTAGDAKFKDWTGITSSVIGSAEPDAVYRQIVMQQYIGLFYQSLEAWNLIRRTQILDFAPHFSPDTGNGAVTPAGKSFSYMPQRLVYPDNEKSNNAVEVSKAIKWLEGGDRMSSKLWFAKPTKVNPYL